MKIDIEFNIQEPRWDSVLEAVKAVMHDGINLIIAKHPNYSRLTTVELSLLMTNKFNMRHLNAQFRNQDKSTNVLSFPEHKIAPDMVLKYHITEESMYLGDIAFCYDTISQESVDLSVTFQDRFIHLFIHGILHLMGYDHITTKMADAMESIENQIVTYLNAKLPHASCNRF